MPVYTRHKRKPRQGTQLDIGHGLVQGLQGFYPLSEASGGIINDATFNSNPMATVGYGSANPWKSASAPVLDGTVNLAGAKVIIPARQQFGYPLTIAVGFRRIANEAGACRFAGLSINNTFTGQLNAIAFTLPTSQTVSLEWPINSTSQTAVSTGFAPALNTDNVMSATIVSSSGSPNGPYIVYANGLQVLNSASTHVDPPVWTATASAYIGAAPGATGTRSSGYQFYWFAWWNRILSAGEHAFIGKSVDSIWDLMLPNPFLWLTSPSGLVQGVGAVTLGGFVISGVGSFSDTGTGAITLGPISVTATGTFTDVGSGAITLGAISAAGTGAFADIGSGAVALGAISPVGTGTFATVGSGAVTLDALSPAGVGSFEVDGTGSIALAGLGVSGVGATGQFGAGTIILGALSVTGTGVTELDGSGAILLAGLTVAGVGVSGQFGTGSIVLAGLIVDGDGTASAGTRRLISFVDPRAAEFSGVQAQDAEQGNVDARATEVLWVSLDPRAAARSK